MPGLPGAAYTASRAHRIATELLLALKPDIHAKGTDYTEETVPEREARARANLEFKAMRNCDLVAGGDGVALPRGVFWWRFEKDGYEPLEVLREHPAADHARR